MEKTLFQPYRLFKECHPEKVVSRRKFEKLRPRNVRVKRAAQRLVCCYTYHVNVMYLTKCVSRIILANQKDTFNFSSNENLCKFLLCDVKNIRCITQQCNECKYFKKLDLFKELHCSKVCFENKSNCENHKINVLQFEKIEYLHKDEKKRKIAVVDKYETLGTLVELLKQRLNGFPRHRFNIQHPKDVIDEAILNLRESTYIMEVQDFSENYVFHAPQNPISSLAAKPGISLPCCHFDEAEW